MRGSERASRCRGKGRPERVALAGRRAAWVGPHVHPKMRLEKHLHQQTGGVLVGVEITRVVDAVFVGPVVVLNAHIQLPLRQVHGFAQVIFDLRVEVQVGVVIAFAVGLFIVHDPVHKAVNQNVRFTHGQGVRPDRCNLPCAITRPMTIVVALVEVELEIVKTRDLQIKTRPDQKRFNIAFAKLVSGRQQYVSDGAQLEFLIENLAHGQARRDFPIRRGVAHARIFLAVVTDVIEEDEVVSVFPAIGMFVVDHPTSPARRQAGYLRPSGWKVCVSSGDSLGLTSLFFHAHRAEGRHGDAAVGDRPHPQRQLAEELRPHHRYQAHADAHRHQQLIATAHRQDRREAELRHAEVQGRHHFQPLRLGQTAEVDHADDTGKNIAQAHADQHRDVDPEAAHEAVDQQDGQQHQRGNTQIERVTETHCFAAAARPVDGHRKQRQTDRGDHRACHQRREEAHDFRHERRNQHAEEPRRNGCPEDPRQTDAVHSGHRHHAAHRGETRPHHDRHADTQRADADRLHHGGNTGDQQVGVDQKRDVFARQSGGLTDDQRHRHGASVHQQDVLHAHQNQLQQWQGLTWRRSRDARVSGLGHATPHCFYCMSTPGAAGRWSAYIATVMVRFFVGAGLLANAIHLTHCGRLTHRFRQQAGSYRIGFVRQICRASAPPRSLVRLRPLIDPLPQQVAFLLGHLGDIAQRHDLRRHGLSLNARGQLLDLLRRVEHDPGRRAAEQRAGGFGGVADGAGVGAVTGAVAGAGTGAEAAAGADATSGAGKVVADHDEQHRQGEVVVRALRRHDDAQHVAHHDRADDRTCVQVKRGVGVEHDAQQGDARHPGPVGFPFEPVQVVRHGRRRQLVLFQVVDTAAVNRPEVARQTVTGVGAVEVVLQPDEIKGRPDPGNPDDHHRVVPDAAMVINTLPAIGDEGAGQLWFRYIAKWRDHDQKRVAEQRNESLAAQRMALQHADGQRHVQRVGAENADDRLVVRRGRFHGRQTMKAHGRAVVDHEMIAAIGFDDITERGEGFFG
nr:hypothetical protein [Tanacetum cinerariifolium]